MVVSCTCLVFKIRSVSRSSLFENVRLGWRPRDKQQQKSRRDVIVCFESFSAVRSLYYTKNIGEGRLKQVDKLEVYFTSGTILRIFRGMRILSSRIPALISTRGVCPRFESSFRGRDLRAFRRIVDLGFSKRLTNVDSRCVHRQDRRAEYSAKGYSEKS